MPRTSSPLLAAAAILALAGCTGGSGGSGGGLLDLGGLMGDDGGRGALFRCDDDRSFRVSFSRDRDRATVEAGDRTYRLQLTDRDDDRRVYGEDGVRLTVDGGDQARLRIEDERDYSDCERA